jgi:hypothetical protein
MRFSLLAGLTGLALSFPVTVSAALSCDLAENPSTAPSGGITRMLYNVDFETPEHTAGEVPQEGLGPGTVGYYHDYVSFIDGGHPEVVVQPLLDSQSAELNARPTGSNDSSDHDELYFQLRRGADYYSIDFDVVFDEHIQLTRTLFSILGTDGNRCIFVFDANNDIYRGQVLGSYQFDTRYHVSLQLVPEAGSPGRVHFTMTQGETAVVDTEFEMPIEDGLDFGGFRIRQQGSDHPDNNFTQVDNIEVKAGYLAVPQLEQANEDGTHVLDHDDAVALVAGVPHEEDMFLVMFGQPTTDVSHDGTPAMRFSSSWRPLITHQLGLPFSIESIELAEYSTVYAGADEVTITGYRFDGSTINKLFVPDGVRDGAGGQQDFQTVTFDNEWQDLRAVGFTTSIAMDDAVLRVNTDVDDDDVHDWLDDCLPDNANEAALSQGNSEQAGCPPAGVNSSGSSGGGAGWFVLAVVLWRGLRRR